MGTWRNKQRRAWSRWLMRWGTSSILVAGMALVGLGSQPQPGMAQSTDEAAETAEDAPRFVCEMNGGEYTVMYYPESQPEASYAWATPGDMGGGWTAERRCNEISRRLEFYRPDGLVELQTSVENSYDIVCVTTEDDPSCRIVFTVPPGQDATQTRDRVFDNIASANSGESTQTVYTFQDAGDRDILNQVGEALDVELPQLGSPGTARSGLYLKPFLDRMDRGTGEYLQEEMRSPGRRLNPEQFR